LIVCLFGIAAIHVNKDGQREQEQREYDASLPKPEISVRASVTELLIQNTGTSEITSLEVVIDGQFENHACHIKAGRLEKMSLIEFVDGAGNRFQPLQRQPKEVTIKISGRARTTYRF
jgi:hypothetical protein